MEKFSLEQLPALRRFYEQLASTGFAERFESSLEAFGASLHHAEFLKIVYTGHAFRRTPKELETALADLKQRFQTLRAEVQKERQRRLRAVPPPKKEPKAAPRRTTPTRPGPRALPIPVPSPGVADVPPSLARVPAVASPTLGAPPVAAAPAAPVLTPVVKAGVTVVAPALPGVLRRVGPPTGRR